MKNAWGKAMIPAGIVCGLLAGSWNCAIGKSFLDGFIGGFIGIMWSFVLLWAITRRFS